ncbi:MAG TPA: GspE/PulE family protein [Flavobacteriales bacterium]|nr:GspE/PulE family protein [Flavobacteriales bacterium]
MVEDGLLELSPELQSLITPEQAWYYRIIPCTQTSSEIIFYTDSGFFRDELLEEIELVLGKSVRVKKIESHLIQRTLSRFYRKAQGHGKIIQVQSGQADDFLSKLIIEARQLGSSDIHIEIYDEKARVRIRIDGMLVERYKVSRLDYPALINKIKIRAQLDIAEKRLPQDGRIRFNESGLKVDIRVSVLPTLHGEKIVLRLLGNDAANIEIGNLGFNETELKRYLEGIKRPNGILLISGPTGSGKTTTLYATLKILNEEKRNIVTVEDPIEYTLEGINQVQLKESIGFASALRTFLRQDPDIIMLGEIRDGETAQMAIRAALTGHLVLSTIHTNSAWGTVSRLIDMGVPPFLLSQTLNTSVAQRLLRLLCPHCKQEAPLAENALPPAFQPPQKLETHFIPVGCEQCFDTGYKGRKAIYEIIPVDFSVSEMIRRNENHIQPLLQTKGIQTLGENAFQLFKSGETSLEEVYPLLMNTQ